MNGNPGFDDEKIFESTELGRIIISQQLAVAPSVNGNKPLGRLLTWKHPEVVFEHDGRDGRDLWCIIGNMVYDITGSFTLTGCPKPVSNSRLDFPFSSEAEEEALIAIASGKRVAADALEGLDTDNLLTRLGPYKCRFLRSTAGVIRFGRRTFTLREIGRHIYPQTGMYCALDGDVFDVGRESGVALRSLAKHSLTDISRLSPFAPRRCPNPSRIRRA
jgi:predicted heme/steroid binding protein